MNWTWVLPMSIVGRVDLGSVAMDVPDGILRIVLPRENALILQRWNIWRWARHPDDINNRGVIMFQFAGPVTITSIGVLDGKSKVEVLVSAMYHCRISKPSS